MEISSLPPSAAAAAAAAATTIPSYPAWILLEKKGYSADSDDATSAQCTITGRHVKVKFCLVPPPSVSYFCVHLSKSKDDDDFDFQPLVIFSAKDLVLFRFNFISRTDASKNLVQYFIYKAGRGNPSLTHIPSNRPGSNDSSCVGIVPYDDDEENYILTDLSVGSEPGYYNLHVYSSKTGKWNTTLLQLLASKEDLPSQFHKVIGLVGDELGWVDLWCGIVTCKVLDNDRVLQLIPLPKPEVHMHLEGEPGLTRDVTYCNGLVKFIEMDHFCKPVIVVDEIYNQISKTMKDFESNDIIHDSELTSPVIVKEEPIILPDGWKIRTFYRSPSWDHWLRAHDVHVDDISVDDPMYSELLALWDACAGRTTLRKLTTYYPTFGIHDDNVVYLISKQKFEDTNAWIVGVDLGKKTVKQIQPYTVAQDGYALPALLPCTFSNYLNTTPGFFPLTETNLSENVPNNATIHGDSSVPDMSYDPLSCAAKATSAPNGTCNLGENNQPLSLDEYGNIVRQTILTSPGFGSGRSHLMMGPGMHDDAHGNQRFILQLGVPSQLSAADLKLINSLMSQHSMSPETPMLSRKQRPEPLSPDFIRMLSRDQRPELLPSARMLPLLTVLDSALCRGGQLCQ